MADLPYIDAAQEVKITGQDSTGTTVYFVGADANGNLLVKDYADGAIGSAVPTNGILISARNPSGNLQAVNMDRNGFINANPNTDKSVFGPLVTLTRVQQLDVDFSESISNNDVVQATTGTGSISLSNSNATVSTGTGTTSSASIQTIGTVIYTPGREMYAQFTAAFTTPTSANSNQFAGLWNGTDGIYLGYNGLNFSIVSMAGGTPTYVAQSSFNLDTLTGGANSQFTRGGTPEAVNFTYKNVWRIRAGWLGAAPIYFEILSPDGNWITFHMIRQPNTSVNPAFLQPSLPIIMQVSKTAADATNLQLITTSWDGGIVDVSGASDTSDSGTIAAVNTSVTVGTEGKATVVVDITGTWVGTLQVQGDTGNGTWNPIYAINTNAVASQTFSANATIIIGCAGFQSVRITSTAWTSGMATMNWVATQGIQAIIAQVVGNIASGSPDSGNPIKIGGVYNTAPPTVASGDRVDLQLDKNGRLLTSSVSLPTTASKFCFGQITTSASATVPMESTTYTEQIANAAMTLVSSSANDSSAGTGARTVTVTYLDQTGAGPYTTIFTMNGTAAVTAGVSNMCFIENIVVSTVGSTESNVGTLTLKSGATTVGTIAATANQTFWAHHYTPTGKTSYITGFNVGTAGTSASQGGVFFLKSTTPTIANTPSIQISDFVSIGGSAPSDTRVYGSPIQIAGPARITAYVMPGATSNYTTYASFDFIDN